jgi:hypothetical protein
MIYGDGVLGMSVGSIFGVIAQAATCSSFGNPERIEESRQEESSEVT